MHEVCAYYKDTITFWNITGNSGKILQVWSLAERLPSLLPYYKLYLVIQPINYCIMARQKGIIKLEGTIGDISFYKSKDGHLARTKGGVDAERIQNDPAFQRTRENGQ